MLTTAVMYVLRGLASNCHCYLLQNGMFVVIKCAYRMWRIVQVSQSTTN